MIYRATSQEKLPVSGILHTSLPRAHLRRSLFFGEKLSPTQ
jgi:hypothetical protein